MGATTHNPDQIKRARRMRKEPTVAERLLWERLRGHRLNAWGFAGKHRSGNS